jgi:hypothetical protein
MLTLTLSPILAAECSAQAEPAATTIQRVDLSADLSRQVVVDREPGQYLGHPSTLLLNDGKTMIAVYPKGHGRGAIVLKKSSDGGLTWSDRLPVPPNWATSRETPTLFRIERQKAGQANRGDLLLMFSGLYPIRIARSEDGVHWSSLEPIGPYGGIVAMSSLISLDDGALVAFFHDDGRFLHNALRPTRFQVFAVRSVDLGQTWSAPDLVLEDSQAHLCEPGIVRSPDGKRYAMLLRENSRKFPSMIAFSDDGELRAWSAPRHLPPSLTGDRHVGRYAPDGRLVITFRDMDPGSPTQGDWVAWVGTFADLEGGTPGQYHVRLKDNHRESDCGYAGLECASDGTFIATSYGHWTPGESPYIVSVRFKLEELDARGASAGAGAAAAPAQPAGAR